MIHFEVYIEEYFYMHIYMCSACWFDSPAALAAVRGSGEEGPNYLNMARNFSRDMSCHLLKLSEEKGTTAVHQSKQIGDMQTAILYSFSTYKLPVQPVK